LLFRFFVICSALNAAVVSRNWADGKLTLKLDDGTAEVEWLTPVSFRFARSFGNSTLPTTHVAHESITPSFEDTSDALTMKSRYLTVEINRADEHIRVRSGDTQVTDQIARPSAVQFTFKSDERVFGLMADGAKLNLRGEKLERRHGFFFTSAGFGIYLESPETCVFDLSTGSIQSPASSIEYDFYYGPTAKEILEQHETVHPHNEVKAESLDLLPPDRLPKQATRLPDAPIRTFEALAALIRKITEWSLSAITYPALNLNIFDSAPADLKGRASDLASIFPIVYRTAGEGGIEVETRQVWTPYLITYLREAYDRGYPLIRPLPIEFSRDAASENQSDVFMLGDEVLLAPVLIPGAKRKLDLPRGNWTDVHTNQQYRGNQTIEIDAPPGRVPMLVRNGWIIPLSYKDRMELHYYPSLGGEFFLWEPDINENSQFHAAPAGDFMRVEVESQKRRTYEWILHHQNSPREVAEEPGAYQRVASRADLKPGTWWHDDAGNNLHLMLRVEPKTDRIVNISF
jgi:alpha-glucosidase (family GH31 glycosyl hydrolase)